LVTDVSGQQAGSILKGQALKKNNCLILEDGNAVVPKLQWPSTNVDTAMSRKSEDRNYTVKER